MNQWRYRGGFTLAVLYYMQCSDCTCEAMIVEMRFHARVRSSVELDILLDLLQFAWFNMDVQRGADIKKIDDGIKNIPMEMVGELR